MTSFASSTVLITGASSGLGAEFARQLAPRAATVVLVARRLDRLEELKTELEGSGADIHVYGLDLADAGATDVFLGWLSERGLEIDLLINNAGLGDYGEFISAEWERVEAMLDVNITALTRLTHRLLPAMLDRRCGTIINLSSSAGFFPLPDLAVYAATKAYVSSFSEALRMELRGTGVRVTYVCPGPVPTEFGEVAQREGGSRIASPEMIRVSPEEVVRLSLRTAAHDRPRVIPGLLLAVGVCIAASLPLVLLRPLLSRR